MIQCNNKNFELYISNQEIKERIKILCEAINLEYKDRKPVFLGILNGVFRVTAAVFDYIDIECEISFIKLKSYMGTTSTGKVTQMLGLDTDLKGKDVILLEDIVDTARTLHNFLPELEKQFPRSIKVFSLLVKPNAMEHKIPLDYVGFEIPNDFIIGFGLDYDGYGRALNDIYKIAE